MAKDYGLTGEARQAAEAAGLANPSWFRPEFDPAEIRTLMVKSDARAARDTALWFGGMIVTAAVAIALYPGLWSVPFWLLFGVLYGSGGDARWHEHGHNTAFKNKRLNDTVYVIASFMMMRNPVVWRASHVRHHTDTIVVGRDPEIQLMRPPDLWKWALNFLGIPMFYESAARLLLHASGRLTSDEEDFVRPEDRPRAILMARLCVALHLGAILWALLAWTWIPVLLIGAPGSMAVGSM